MLTLRDTHSDTSRLRSQVFLPEVVSREMTEQYSATVTAELCGREQRKSGPFRRLDTREVLAVYNQCRLTATCTRIESCCETSADFWKHQLGESRPIWLSLLVHAMPSALAKSPGKSHIQGLRELLSRTKHGETDAQVPRKETQEQPKRLSQSE